MFFKKKKQLTEEELKRKFFNETIDSLIKESVTNHVNWTTRNIIDSEIRRLVENEMEANSCFKTYMQEQIDIAIEQLKSSDLFKQKLKEQVFYVFEDVGKGDFNYKFIYDSAIKTAFHKNIEYSVSRVLGLNK